MGFFEFFKQEPEPISVDRALERFAGDEELISLAETVDKARSWSEPETEVAVEKLKAVMKERGFALEPTMNESILSQEEPTEEEAILQFTTKLIAEADTFDEAA